MSRGHSCRSATSSIALPPGWLLGHRRHSEPMRMSTSLERANSMRSARGGASRCMRWHGRIRSTLLARQHPSIRRSNCCPTWTWVRLRWRSRLDGQRRRRFFSVLEIDLTWRRLTGSARWSLARGLEPNLPILRGRRSMAAARRMSKLLGHPAAVLMDVRAHVAECFRRLYRVRNVILHAGRTDPVGLRATLRPAPPLVGAGMDRIAHAHLVSGTAPLELVARAELEIARAGLSAAPSIVEMLE
jgi:hypothetical protein